MSTAELRKILARRGYALLAGATPEPCQIWQSQEGRRVLLDTQAGRILNKADIEARIVDCCGPDTAPYYRAVIHNWE